MAGRAPSKKPDFSEILERGAQVDDIFKDQPTPLGSDPFELKESETESTGSVTIDSPKATVAPATATATVAPLLVDDPAHLGLTRPDEDLKFDEVGVGIVDNDSLFCINRKFAAIESLFKLVTRDQWSFGQLISEILKIAMEQVKSEAGSFLEVDHQNNCMFFRAAAGRQSEGLLNFTVPLGQGIAGFVCETQQPMALSSIDDSSVYLRSISNAVGFETKNMVAYPVVIRGVTFGCLELLNRLGEPQFTDADKEVLNTVCAYGAKVIENRLMLAAISKELAMYRTKKTEDAA